MTTLTSGDLVLRDGRVEEVSELSSGALRYTTDRWQTAHLCTHATRIGNVRDGWRIHTGSERPVDVAEDDRVEFWQGTKSDLDRGPRRAGDLVWRVILAYRNLTRRQAEQDAAMGGQRQPVPGVYADPKFAAVEHCPDGVGCEVKASELREGDRVRVEVELTVEGPSICDELLRVVKDRHHFPVERSLLEHATITLLARKPESLKVGDRVVEREVGPVLTDEAPIPGEIVAIVRGYAVVDWGGVHPTSFELSRLERLP